MAIYRGVIPLIVVRIAVLVLPALWPSLVTRILRVAYSG